MGWTTALARDVIQFVPVDLAKVSSRPAGRGPCAAGEGGELGEAHSGWGYSSPASSWAYDIIVWYGIVSRSSANSFRILPQTQPEMLVKALRIASENVARSVLWPQFEHSKGSPRSLPAECRTLDHTFRHFSRMIHPPNQRERGLAHQSGGITDPTPKRKGLRISRANDRPCDG